MEPFSLLHSQLDLHGPTAEHDDFSIDRDVPVGGMFRTESLSDYVRGGLGPSAHHAVGAAPTCGQAEVGASPRSPVAQRTPLVS